MQASQVNATFNRMSESELLACVRRGDRLAFRAVMRRYNQPLYRTARGIMRDDAEAEDVVQEAWVRGFAAIADFRGDAALLTWLTRIVINEARGRLRKQRPSAGVEEIERAQQRETVLLGFPGGQTIENPEAQAARAEARVLVESAVDRLPESFRMVFLLRDVQECSIEETAAILELRPETIKTRLHRARRLLRTELDSALADALNGSFPFLGRRCERLTEAVMTRLAGPSGPGDAS
ncbi:MAG: RNA polymerase sigma factor [Novosphingobium sp.]